MMSASPELRVVLVGRELSIQPLEKVLTFYGALNYICVPSIDAAEWLIRDGFDADLLIVHDSLLPRASDLMRLRTDNPQCIVLPTPSICASEDVRGALNAAARRRQDRQPKRDRPRLFAAFGRRLAWS